MDRQYSGSYCTFSIFLICNLLLLAVGLSIASIAIYICADQNDFSWYDGAFSLLGFIVVLTALSSLATKTSLKRLFVYMLFLLVLTLIIFALTIGLIAYSDFELKIGFENAQAVRYSYIGCCVVMIMCVVVGFFYRKTLMVAIEESSREVNFNDIQGPLIKKGEKAPEISKGFERTKQNKKKKNQPESLFELR